MSADRGSGTVLPTVLRLSAIVLLVVGFVGAVSTDTSPVALDSVYSRLFWAGVGCAVVSIYLGIFLHGRE